VTWKIYIHPDNGPSAGQPCGSDIQCLASTYSYLNQFSYGRYVLTNMPGQYATTDQLLTDMQNGTLPEVAFIDPAGYVALDEHPTGTDVLNAPNVQSGAKYVQGIIDTLMSSPSWKDTVFIFSYDEGGGFYDHVPPAAAVPPDSIEFPSDLASNDICFGNTTSLACGFFNTGFRVPLIVISPFAKKNYVSHTVMDSTAILKFIETRFSLPPLTARDAAQPDMTEFFDFVGVPWATPPTPPTQMENMPCVLEALTSITVSPNPAPAGGVATVSLNLSQNADTTVVVSSNPNGVVPANAVIRNGTSTTSFSINVPNGIVSLSITGTIAGIPVSGTVPVQ
jgi:phospholipase C